MPTGLSSNNDGIKAKDRQMTVGPGVDSNPGSGGAPSTPSSSYTDPLTTDGDLLVRTGGATDRLAAGTNGQVLKVVSGEPAWDTDDDTQYVPAAGTSGQVLAKASATDYDLEWIDAASGGGGTQAGARARVSHTSTQNISNTTGTDLSWDTIHTDNGGFFDISSPTVFTAPRDGLYLVSFRITYTGASTGRIFLQFKVNGTDDWGINNNHKSSTAGVYYAHSYPIPLSAGDTVTARVYQDTGGTIAITKDDFQIVEIVASAPAAIHAQVIRAAAQSLTNNTATDVEWDTLGIDTAGMTDIGGSNPERITIPESGYYLLTWNVQFASNSSGFRRGYVQVTGAYTLYVAISSFPANSGSWDNANGSQEVYLTAGDYLTLKLYQNSGGSLNAEAGGTTQIFSLTCRKLEGPAPEAINPTIQVRRTSTQSIANTTTTAIQFDTVFFASDATMFTATDSKIYAREAGIYAFSGYAEFASNSSGNRQFFVRKNGDSLRLAFHKWLGNSGSNDAKQLVGMVDMQPGDYLEFQVYQDSGGALNISYASSAMPMFNLHKVSSLNVP